MNADRTPGGPEINQSRLMWLEPDCSLTPMTRVRGGGVQCFSNDVDPSACGLNLAGQFYGRGAIPQKLISESLNGNAPFYLVWSNCDLTNLSHLNGIYLQRILKFRRGLTVRWRPDPDRPEVSFSFTIPLRRASVVTKICSGSSRC
ncbi:hypothetical protein GR226_04850 [Rhizobium leguminosarum]|uniref:hypothetical protein n=1 Tax=Rhizobium ruizarguesonis TaxID=2081791 RepID=UPI0013DD5387|nr:hypothetical protein [Rhizobium ruizarguesonis]NEH83067.1 hypothetical protein [Rhizobium ruizarguesonis]